MTAPPFVVDQCDRCAAGTGGNADVEPERLEEQARWHELHSLADQLSTEELLAAGYFAEGWSVRDMLAHIGAWLAEAGLLLEQMRVGTYVEGELDVDAANARFFELMRDIPLGTVLLQAWAARTRMLAAWAQLPTPRPPEADRWLAKAGAAHYAEHLPRLHAWTAELLERRAATGGPRWTR